MVLETVLNAVLKIVPKADLKAVLRTALKTALRTILRTVFKTVFETVLETVNMVTKFEYTESRMKQRETKKFVSLESSLKVLDAFERNHDVEN